MNLMQEGQRFKVKCLRCNNVFEVIRNWGGGIRRADNENINPARCKCGAYKLEIY